MYSDLRWRVRSALLLFIVFGGVWFFDEWQRGMPIPPGSWLELEDSASVPEDDLHIALRRVRWDGHILHGEVCLAVLGEDGRPVERPWILHLPLSCQCFDLWRQPIGPSFPVDGRRAPRPFSGQQQEDTISFSVDAPTEARYVSVGYRSGLAILDRNTPLAKLPRRP